MLAYKSGKGWSTFRQLLVSMLTFLSPHLGRVSSMTDLSEGIRTLYRGALRVLLVLLHDFPDFLCDYHFALCDAIPPNCVQMRNLVLSAYPPSMRLPDPFMPNLKVDKLLEMASEPRVLSNFTTALVSSGLKGIVDKYLQDTLPRGGRQFEALGLSNRLLSKDSDTHSRSYNIGAVNALVLYLGQQSISKSSPDGQPIINGPCTEILQDLVSELDTEARYHVFNAIANHLRYPNKHTHYFSCVLLFLFRDAVDEGVKEQITRVLVERLIANRPHPWGLLITFIELIKNPSYKFWSHDFVRCAPQIERLFENVARFCSGGGSASGSTGDSTGLTDDVSGVSRPVPFAS
jgi:CCR4-NOT transcription complex subunit 1